MSLGEMTPGKLKILKAVATLLEDPSAKITISQIAKTIHVTDAAIYRHYKSKDEIFKALMGYMESNMLAPLNSVQQETSETYPRMEAIYNQYMDFIEGHPGLARLFLGHGAHEANGLAERIKLLHAKMRSQIAQILRFGQARRELLTDLEPEQATELFYGLMTGGAMAQAYGLPQVDNKGRWEAFSSTTFAQSAKSKAA